MVVFLQSRTALAFCFEQTHINWIGEFSMSAPPRCFLPLFSIISLCAAVPLTHLLERCFHMRIGPKKGVEVKCIHKHEEGTEGQWRRRERSKTITKNIKLKGTERN